MSAHWDIKNCIWKIHPLWFYLSFASKPPLPKVDIFVLLNFFSLSFFQNPLGNLIWIPLLSLVALLMCAVSLVSVPHMAQGQFSMGGVGTFPAWDMTLLPRVLHTGFSLMPCANPWSAGWPLPAMMREMSAGLLLGLFQVSWNSFQMSFMQEGSGGCYISQAPGSGGLDYQNSSVVHARLD